MLPTAPRLLEVNLTFKAALFGLFLILSLHSILKQKQRKDYFYYSF